MTTKSFKEALIKKDNFVYGGDLESSTLDGIGFSVIENRTIYYGEWNDDTKNGTGLFLYPNGILYIGIFEKNQLKIQYNNIIRTIIIKIVVTFIIIYTYK